MYVSSNSLSGKAYYEHSDKREINGILRRGYVVNWFSEDVGAPMYLQLKHIYLYLYINI